MSVPTTSCAFQVARVGVHSGQLLEMQKLSRSWLLGQCAQQQVDVNHTGRLLRLLVDHLPKLPQGSYLLTHQPGAAAVCCFGAKDGISMTDQTVRLLMQALSVISCACFVHTAT